MGYPRRCVSVLVTLSMLLSIGVLAPPAGGTAGAQPVEWDVYSGDSIQTAIDTAAAGDIITVHPGTYTEDLSIDKSLTLRSSDGAAATTIEGSVVINLLDSETVVFGQDGAGFTVTAADRGIDAVVEYWSALIIEGSIFTDNDHGIRVRYVHYFSRLEIRGNEISYNSADGVNIGSDGPGVRYHSSASIVDNVITDNGVDGIHWNDIFDNSHGLIQGNTITGNGDDGIWFDDVEHGSSLDVLDNVVSDNAGRGIHLYEYEDGCEGLIQGNTIERNGEDGIYMTDDPSDGSRLIIRDNSVVENGGYGLRFDGVEHGGYLAVSDNEIADNLLGGIRLYEVNNGGEGLIDGNSLTGNSGYGICISSGLDYGGYLVIEGNTISGVQYATVTNEAPNGWDVNYYLEHDDVVPDSVKVYVDDVLTSAYTLDPDNGTIVFDAVPSGIVTVDYSYGGVGIYIGDEVGEGSDLAILDNEVVDNGSIGIYVEEIERGGEVVIAEGNTISRNGTQGVKVGSGDYGVSEGSSLAITGNDISDNADNGIDVLLIAEGSRVLIESNTLSGNAYGVYVTEMDDGSTLDIVGNTITGQSSGGIRAGDTVEYSAVNVLDNTISGNIGIGLQIGEGETLTDSKATIRCNTIYNNTEWGIYMVVEHSLVDISGNHIHANGTSGTEGGIYIDGLDLDMMGIHQNSIAGNYDWGLLNDSSEEVAATRNWWGDASGPNHDTTNTGGLGDEVSDDVDYADWLAVQPALCALYEPAVLTPSTITVDGAGGAHYTTIQAAIDAADPGDIIVVSPGTYSEDLTIEKSLNILSTDGAEQTTIDGTVTINLVDAAAVTFGGAGSGFTVTGSSPGFEVSLSSWSQLAIEGNIITGCDGDGIYVDRVRRWSLLSVLDNEITDNDGEGVDIYRIQWFGQVLIEGNTISGNRYGINIEEILDAGELVIRDNAIVENPDGGIYLTEVPALDNGSSMAIVGNEITGNGFDGECNRGRGVDWRSVFDGSHGLVQGNTVTGNAREGIYFDDADHGSSLDILDNTVSDNGGFGIRLFVYEDGCTGLIHGNTITGNGRDGFHIVDNPSHGSRVTVEQNAITGNGGKGFRVRRVVEGSHLAVVGNRIEDNQGMGMYLYEVDNGSDCLIDGNSITGNVEYGIYVESGADHGGVLTLTGNTISDTGSEITGVYVGVGCEGEGYFELPHSPLVPGSETIYLDGVEVPADDYSMNYEYGELSFDTAPGNGVFVSADYTLEEAGWGIYVDNDVDEGSVLTISGNDVTDNALDGIFIRDIGYDGAGAVIGEANIVSGNGAHGVAIGRDEYGVRNGSSLSIADNEITGNVENGIHLHKVESGSVAQVDGNSVAGNGGSGLWLCGEEDTLKDGEAHVLGNTFDANDGWGIYVYLEHALLDVSGCNKITGNAAGGMYIDGEDLDLVGIHNNNIEGNSVWGLLNESGETVDALSNWWGVVSGPYHPDSNAAGAGDPVSDNVLYDPWMTASCEPSNVAAAFQASARSGAPGLSVRFTDRSTSGCDIVEWLWDFGDGGTSTAQNPTHVFLRPGTFTVTLTVWDTCGYSNTVVMRAYITVARAAARALSGASRDDVPEPAKLGVSYLHVDPLQVLPGQEVTVSANVCNHGEERGTMTVSFVVNGETVASQSVSASGGACQQVTFTVARAIPGAYQVAIDGMVGQFSVVAPRTVTQSVPSQQQSGLGTAGLIAIIAVMLVLIAALIMVFRRT